MIERIHMTDKGAVINGYTRGTVRVRLGSFERDADGGPFGEQQYDVEYEATVDLRLLEELALYAFGKKTRRGMAGPVILKITGERPIQ